MVSPLVIAGIAAGAGSAINIGSGIYAARKERKALRRQADSLDEQARYEEEAAQFDAMQTAIKFDELLGEQKLSTAASGVEAEGSTLDIFAKTISDKQITINNILEEGRRRAQALREEASQAIKTSKGLMRNAIISGLGKGISSGASIYSATKGGK